LKSIPARPEPFKSTLLLSAVIVCCHLRKDPKKNASAVWVGRQRRWRHGSRA
jgi:hypothetical protein